MQDAKKKPGSTKPRQSKCEDCEFYDYDDDLEAYVCSMNLDEDEMLRFLQGDVSACPYYRYYDEYKTVRSQN